MIRRVLAAAGTAVTVAGAVLAGAALPASAATPTTPLGGVSSAQQDLFAHRLTVVGWAYLPARSSSSIDVRVYVDHHYAGHVPANLASPGIDRYRHIGGKHVFRFARTWTPTAKLVTIRAVALHGSAVTLDSGGVRHVMPAPGSRIVTVAKRYVGKARYVEGGASPSRGFDCSGYTEYVYTQAKVAKLPHNADAQRRMHGMRRISAGQARPGDLVFYLSGGSAYHVAIYAGHGMQYAAATPRDGIRYQHVWSRSVVYGTDWH